MSNKTPDIHEHATVPRTDHITDEQSDCPHWCGACRANEAAGMHPDGEPREQPAENLIQRIIALNGAFPDRETWVAWESAGGKWLNHYTRGTGNAITELAETGWDDWAAPCMRTGTWHAIDSQGRRIDYAQEIEWIKQAVGEQMSKIAHDHAQEVAYARKDRDRLQSENERLQGRANSLFIERTQAHERLAEVLAENEKLTARVAELEAEQSAPSSAAATYKQLYEDEQVRTMRLCKRIAKLNALCAAESRARGAEQQQTAEQIARVRELEYTAQRAEENRRAAESQARDAQRARDELAAGAAELQQRLGAMVAQRDCYQTAYEGTKAELAAERQAHAWTKCAYVAVLAERDSQWPRNLGANLALGGFFTAIGHSLGLQHSPWPITRPAELVELVRLAHIAHDELVAIQGRLGAGDCYAPGAASSAVGKVLARRDRWRQRYEQEKTLRCTAEAVASAARGRQQIAELALADAVKAPSKLALSRQVSRVLATRLARAVRIIRVLWPLRAQLRAARANLTTVEAAWNDAADELQGHRVVLQTVLIDAALAGLLADVPAPQEIGACFTRLLELAASARQPETAPAACDLGCVDGWARTDHGGVYRCRCTKGGPR